MNVPAISDDTLQCFLYPTEDTDRSVLLAQITEFTQQLLPNHIWHRDSFLLTLSSDEGSAMECTMRVGDSVDDEWLVVFLLWQITKNFNVAARVHDGDGQFLLIEAADALPSWVTPENVDNRVWIYQGHLHIIPLSYQSSSKTYMPKRMSEKDKEANPFRTEMIRVLPVEEALNILRASHEDTRASDDVEQIIRKKISGFPQAATSLLHRTKAALPIDVAKALAIDPQLIQRAVECFYTRDHRQLRSTQKMTRFPPSESVTATVTMTRTAYAQLMGQRFTAPRIFRQPANQSKDEARWWDIGVKIACGFEMLYQESRTRSERLRTGTSGESIIAKIDALRRDPGYNMYISSLEARDFFEGQMRDSERWKEKERQAAEMWISMRQADDASRPSFADLVTKALQSNPDAMLRDEGEDSDEWLNVDPMDVDQTLSKYLKSQTDNEAISVRRDSNMDSEDQVVHEQAQQLKNLADKMEGFVEREGALEGAMFDDDLLSDEEDEDSDEDESEKEDPSARQAAMNALVAPLEPGEYGKMPLSYRHPNTQTTMSNIEEASNQEREPQGNSDTTRPVMRPLIFQRDKFDGVDSDDETSEEEDGNAQQPVMGEDGEALENDEDRPQVVGEVEIDMAQEEEDFLRFSREALGIDDDTWKRIIADREKRGVYVPQSATGTSRKADEAKPVKPQGPSAARFFEEIPKIAVTPRPDRKSRATDTSSTDKTPNMELNSFEAVMDAMEKELARLQAPALTKPKSSSSKPIQSQKKGKGRAYLETAGQGDADGEDEEMVELQEAMDLELRSALKRDVHVASSGSEDEDEEDEEPMDYNLIKNFLESFKSQQGLGGPVSGLAGRLQGSDWVFPDDAGDVVRR